MNELTERKRGRPAGEELRRRVVAAVLERGMSGNAAARHFEVGEASVRRWIVRYLERGHLRDDPRPGRPSSTEPERERIFRLLEKRPDLSVGALQRALAAEGPVISTASLYRFLKRHSLWRHRRRAARRRNPAPKAGGRG
ncbi:MAG: transposase [Alphaproteobacteria bacterium]|nr:transposase [Alphaproteobacteria bacterium]